MMGAGGAYMVFILQARGEADTTVTDIRPGTPEAESQVRARFARAKTSWGQGSQAIPIVVALGSANGEESGNGAI